MTVLAFAPRLVGRAPRVAEAIRRAEILALAKAYVLDPGVRARFLRRAAIAGEGLSTSLSERTEIIHAIKRHLACDSYVRARRPGWANSAAHRDELVAALIGELRQARKERRRG